MQFTKPFKQAIAEGRVSRSFRVWKTPQAKAGGRYNIPPYGAIEVHAVHQVTLEDATDISRSGFDDRESLAAFLGVELTDPVYQVDFEFIGSDAVNIPDRAVLSSDELAVMCARLQRMDERRAGAPWTKQALTLIARHPLTRAADLAPQCAMDTPTFKRQVRKLKGLGLTLSGETGYQLSPRGLQVFEQLSKTS